jgi:hypothetical protein
MVARVIATAVVFVAACPLFAVRAGEGDVLLHIEIARGIYEHVHWPPHPLFHLVLIALSGGELYPPPGLAAPGLSVFLCAASLAAATWLTATMIEQAGAYPALAGVISVFIAFAMPIRDWWHGDVYLGKLSPNEWHNPTGVFAMPFALGLFMAAVRLFDRPGLGRAALVGLAAALSLLSKPNYFLAFAPCLGIGLLAIAWQMRSARAIGLLALALGPAAVILGAQWVWYSEDTKILYAPFEVWRNLSHEHMWDGALVSVAFPLAVVVCYPLRANADRNLTIAWITLAVGIGTFICFAEWGARLRHGNFGWGMIYANHVLFAVSAAFLFGQRNDPRRWLCLTVLAAHFGTGIMHVLHVWYW